FTLFQPCSEFFCPTPEILWLYSRLFACGHFFFELDSLPRQMVDFLDQARTNSRLDFVGLLLAPGFNFLIMGWCEMLRRMVQRQGFEVAGDPRGLKNILQLFEVVVADRLQVQVGRPSSMPCLAVLIDFHELQAA